MPNVYNYLLIIVDTSSAVSATHCNNAPAGDDITVTISFDATDADGDGSVLGVRRRRA
jgi:hypothetical protein